MRITPCAAVDYLLLSCKPLMRLCDTICENRYNSESGKLRRARQKHPGDREHSQSETLFNPFKRQRRTRKSKTQASDQKPGFANLPLEIRLIIYNLVFEGMREIHIMLKNGRICGIPCIGYRPVYLRTYKGKTCRCPARREAEEYIAGRPSYAKLDLGIPNLLPLLLTCRFIYSDISDLIYSGKTIIFSTPEELLLFTFSLAPHTLEKIRSIKLDSIHETFRHRSCKIKPPARFDDDVLCMSRPIRRKYKNAYQVPTLVRFLGKGSPSGRGPPSVWGAAWERVAEMKGLESIRIFLDYRNFDLESAGALDDDDGYHESGDTMWYYKFAFEPMAKTAEILGDKVLFDVTTDWKIGAFGDVVDEERLWKWVKFDGSINGDFRTMDIRCVEGGRKTLKMRSVSELMSHGL